MQELVLDGATYVPLKTAAAQSGYEKNYLGQLCRAGKVDGRLVGRNWYINLDSLDQHTSREYGNRGTMAFVAKKEDVSPTVFPRMGDFTKSDVSDLPNKNIDISDKSAALDRSHFRNFIPTTNSPSSSGICETPVSPGAEGVVLKAPTRVAVIPVQQSSHTQPKIDLTNLLPPPPKGESLVTPRIRPISRYFKEDTEEEEDILVPVSKNASETTNSLQEEVSVLRQERERRAHQYLVQSSTPKQIRIDPIPNNQSYISTQKQKLSLDWFVPVSVALMGLILLGGVGYLAFEQLSHKEYATEGTVRAQQTASVGSIIELLFERRVEFK